MERRKGQIIVGSLEEAQAHEARVLSNALCATEVLGSLLNKESGAHVLLRLKFEPLGFDPFGDGRGLNLIEQINQSFTYLVSLRAAEYLLAQHPEATPLRLNPGARRGWDIHSDDLSVIAETFAAVRPENNRKLIKDVERVASAPAAFRYVIYSSSFPPLKQIERPGVIVKRIPAATLLDTSRPLRFA